MSIYAQLEDMAAWSGMPIVPDQASEIQFLLNEAEIELEVIAGDLGGRITAGLTTPQRVKAALCGMVGRVTRDRAQAEALLAESASTATQDALREWLKVGRRERWLVGMTSSGDSMDLSTRDPQLVYPFVRPPLDRWSGRC
jgi:hypothetical protein